MNRALRPALRALHRLRRLGLAVGPAVGLAAGCAVALWLALLAWRSFPVSTATEVAHPQAVWLTQAATLEAGPLTAEALHAGPPAPAAPWQAATLPDNWDGRRPQYTGQVWYRLAVPAAAVAAARPRPALYLPAYAMNAELWLNGQRLGSQGRLHDPVSRHFYTPWLLEPPPALWRGDGRDELMLRVVGHPGYRCGLAGVWLGPYEPLYAAWQRRSGWQGVGTLATIVINLAIGVYVLLIAWRGHGHAAYAWFGAAAIVWGLRNFNYVSTDPPLPDLLWAELCVSGAAWFTGLFAIFAQRFAEAEDPHWRGPRWLPPAIGVYMVGATLYFISADSYRQANAGFASLAAIGVSLTVWSQWRLLHLAWRQRRPVLTAVGIGALTYLVLLLHDYAVGVDKQSLGEVFVRQYAALPLFLAITATLAQRYLQALARERGFSAELRREVAAQRVALEHSFSQLQQVEQARAREQERSRLMSDLHDGLGLHLVTALRQARRDDTPRAAVVATLQDCLDDLRLAIDSLDAHERDPLALLGSLRWRMAPRFESLGLQLAWQVDEPLPPLPVLDANQALHLLRIVQEALTNVLKHSQATQVTLALGQADGAVCIELRDNGLGRSEGAAAAGRGLGHMQARAQQLGARLSMAATPGGGCTVRLVLSEHRP